MQTGRLAEDQIAARLESLAGWSRSGEAIRRRYAFADFAGSMRFVERVARLAEEADHHPDILIEYDKVTLTLTSHDAGGLTARDFSLAERIDG